jgi:hypothetical protein
VRADEQACPFCNTALAAAPSTTPRELHNTSITRAALLVATSIALASCHTESAPAPPYGRPPMDPARSGGEVSPTPDPPAGLALDADGGSPDLTRQDQPVYGAPSPR